MCLSHPQELLFQADLFIFSSSNTLATTEIPETPAAREDRGKNIGMSDEPSETEASQELVQCTQEQTAGSEDDDKLSKMGQGSIITCSKEPSLDSDEKQKSEDEKNSKAKKRIRFAPAAELEEINIISYNDGLPVQSDLENEGRGSSDCQLSELSMSEIMQELENYLHWIESQIMEHDKLVSSGMSELNGV